MLQSSPKLPESFDAGNRPQRGEERNYLVEMIHSRKEESAQAGAGAAAAPVWLLGLEKQPQFCRIPADGPKAAWYSAWEGTREHETHGSLQGRAGGMMWDSSISSRNCLAQIRSITTPSQASQAFLWVLLLQGFQPAPPSWTHYSSVPASNQTSQQTPVGF